MTQKTLLSYIFLFTQIKTWVLKDLLSQTQKYSKILIVIKKKTIQQSLSIINKKRSVIPGVTHVDYSARIQTVSKSFNKFFFELLNEFYKLTNTPILINTSFNIRGEPIVCSPADAFKCFMGTKLDFLVIENFILDKKRQNKKLLKNYKSKFDLDWFVFNDRNIKLKTHTQLGSE